MIYQLKCSCQESKDFQLEIDVDSCHTFFDLHHLLQTLLNYQPAQLAAFHVPDQKRGQKEIEISQLDPCYKKSFHFYMNNTLIGDILSPGRIFLRYVFDLMNDRYLRLELTGTNMEKSLKKPVVKLNQGEAPVQVLDEGMTDGLFEFSEEKMADSDYGILNDYYEIFGEMEEYVL
jgi:hypothetical protein